MELQRRELSKWPMWDVVHITAEITGWPSREAVVKNLFITWMETKKAELLASPRELTC